MSIHLGEKSRTASDGKMVKAWDHDPPTDNQLVTFGILVLGTSALTLIFGRKECSDFWGDCLKQGWQSIAKENSGIKRLCIFLDNGPKNAGNTKKFLRRIVEFVDATGLEVRLVYYPPYHSKHNPVERCWSSLQRKWNGLLLSSWDIVLSAAKRMTWCGCPPKVALIDKLYTREREITKSEFSNIETRIERSDTLPKYDFVVKPQPNNGR